MSAYLIVQIKLLADRNQLAPYRDAVKPCAAQFGGHYIVGGGVKVKTLEASERDGKASSSSNFPSFESIQAFWSSPDYIAIKKLREGLVELDAWAVPGVV